MAKNDFKAFATDRNANVMSQEEWEALPALLSGFTAGKASSAQVNKVIRQASFIAAALAQFVSDKTQRDVLDNGDLPGFVELLGSGFAVEYLSRKNPFGDIKSDGTVKTALENLGFGERLLEADGYFELPGGLLLQWGHGSIQATNATVRFKKPFNVTPFIVLPHKITADNRYVTSVNYTLTGFSLYGWNGGGVATNIDSYTYFALGM